MYSIRIIQNTKGGGRILLIQSLPFSSLRLTQNSQNSPCLDGRQQTNFDSSTRDARVYVNIELAACQIKMHSRWDHNYEMNSSTAQSSNRFSRELNRGDPHKEGLRHSFSLFPLTADTVQSIFLAYIPEHAWLRGEQSERGSGVEK